MKKLLALLLALAMMFSLAACASKDDDDDEDEDDERTEETAKPEKDDEDEAVDALYDYGVFLDAMRDFMEDPSVRKLCFFEAGTLAGDELYAFLHDFLEAIGASEDDYLAQIMSDIPEGITMEMTEQKPLTEDELEDVEDDLEEIRDAVGKVMDYLDDLMENGTDEQWQAEAQGMNMTVDEAKAFLPKYRDLFQDLYDAMDAELDEGCEVTIERSNDTTDVYGVYITKDGKWFSELLLTALSGLVGLV